MNSLLGRLGTWAPAAAIVGGLLWILYAILALLQPLGTVNLFISDTGQLSATNPGAFRIAALTGGLALILLGAALIGTIQRYELRGAPAAQFGTGVPSRFGGILAWAGVAAGLLVSLGGLVLQVPLATLAQLLGAVFVPFAASLVAIEANGSETAYPIAAPMFIVGALGMAAVLAQAMVALYAWMLPVYGALVLAIYGFVWVRVGGLMQRHEQ